MVVVDSSVWIRYFKNQSPWADELDRLLILNDVAAHEFVYGELLIGNPGGRLKALEAYWGFTTAPVVPHKEVIAFVELHRLSGRGVGWIDVHLLASALVGRLTLWSADQNLVTLAREFNIAHTIPGLAPLRLV
ncbi:MAG TPA: PIN domain-containing protein [Bryobacteraceae bacterium]|jgi:hypothetical protein